jgi:hypothetical protein
MKRYRRKTEVVEAQQWHAGNDPLSGMRPTTEISAAGHRAYTVNTPVGPRWVRDGNWLVVENGQRNVFTADEFEEKYEPAE